MAESYSWVKVEDLVPWERNPKEHGDDIPGIARSIVRFGWLDPIVAWKSERRIIGGHGRTLAAKLLLTEDAGRMFANDAPGPGLIPVRFVEFSSEMEANAAGVALNRHTERNPMNEEAVAELIREMEEAGASLEGLGYSEEEIAEIVDGGEPEPGDPDEDDVPEPPVEPTSKLGEVYELGPHRLVCGDSTKAETWAALLRGEKVQMVWTDPPYGVAVNAVKDAEEAKRLHRRTDGLLVMNDSLSPEQLEVLLRAALGHLFAHCEPGASWYVAAPPGPLHNVFGAVLIALDVWRRSLIWMKDRFAFGRGDYHYRHEPIFYGWKPGAAHYFIDDHTQDSVHEFPRPSRSEEHPTMKPVDLVRRHIRNSSNSGWIIGEPFGGSGTTLLAAAAEGRVARLIELDPRYCDVIRRRWTTYADANELDAGPGALRAA